MKYNTIWIAAADALNVFRSKNYYSLCPEIWVPKPKIALGGFRNFNQSCLSIFPSSQLEKLPIPASWWFVTTVLPKFRRFQRHLFVNNILKALDAEHGHSQWCSKWKENATQSYKKIIDQWTACCNFTSFVGAVEQKGFQARCNPWGFKAVRCK